MTPLDSGEAQGAPPQPMPKRAETPPKSRGTDYCTRFCSQAGSRFGQRQAVTFDPVTVLPESLKLTLDMVRSPATESNAEMVMDPVNSTSPLS